MGTQPDAVRPAIGAGSFADLRRLAEWLATPRDRGARGSLHIDRIVRRLGATAVPLLGRELRTGEPARRDAARIQLAAIAATARARVLDELRRTLDASVDDDTKVCALGLLAELGERTAARFADPVAIQRRSALALAAQLDTVADVAAAADLMVRQLAPDDIVAMLEVMGEAAAVPARALAAELGLRLDLPAELRARVATLVQPAAATDDGAPARRSSRPAQVAVLIDAALRIVVIASRKLVGERRFRRWAVLIAASGKLDDCMHDDAITDDAAPLIASLCADGYRVASSDHDHARALIAAAARRTGAALPSPYYLGRDLLDLETAHLEGHAHVRPNAVARAIELLGDGHAVRALAALAIDEAADPARASADVAATAGACWLALDQLAVALPWLERAAAAEPAWPLHHWNLAALAHRTGDATACFRALARFTATSSAPTALLGDPDQPARLVTAERLLAELERTARLAGTVLARPRRRRRRKS